MQASQTNPKAHPGIVKGSACGIHGNGDALLKSEEWYTGKRPEFGVCPGVDADGKIHSLPIPNLATCSRQDIRNYFDNSWTLTEVLLSGLSSAEVFYRVPYHGLRHPLVFYYIHQAVLYVNKLRLAGLVPNAVNREFESIFETGVDEMSWDDMSKNTMQWSELPALHDYRKQVYKLICNLISNHEGLEAGHAAIGPADALWALVMGFEHERIHLETSSVLIRELPIDCVRRPQAWPNLEVTPGEPNFPPIEGKDYPLNQLLKIEQGEVEIGKAQSIPHFGWDNEYGKRNRHVDEFEVSQNLITNGEFYDFVSSGAYLQQQYWSNNGWKWRSFRNTKFPTFWKPEGPAGFHRYKLRTCFEIVPMQWSWPAVVNFYEAEAYCKWLSTRSENLPQYRLITEAEHHRLRSLNHSSTNATGTLDDSKFNLNLVSGAERAVSMDLENNETGVGDLFGNVWQWCEDHFNPLEGFSVNKFYDDFSVPCFDGEHQMILGGSFISTGDEATTWARFHFRPHFFQHAGFRIVKSTTDGGAVKLGSEQTSNPYETQSILNEYLTLHFAPADAQMPFSAISKDLTAFPQRCADVVLQWSHKLGLPTQRALDVGCAVGGASFKLAEKFDHVTAVDLSQSFIDAAKQMQAQGKMKFQYKTEGEQSRQLEATVDRQIASRVEFRRADACALPPEFVDYDAVLLANLICRLPSPMSCLSRMSGPRGIVRRGGLLVMMTPFTWMETFTPKQLWFGGQADAERSSEDSLIEKMSADFELLEKFDMPLLIREHNRKYQLIFSLASVWRRK